MTKLSISFLFFFLMNLALNAGKNDLIVDDNDEQEITNAANELVEIINQYYKDLYAIAKDEVIKGDNGYFCPECDQGYRGHEGATEHVAYFHKGLKPYSCQNCDNVSYYYSGSLRAHSKRCKNASQKL